MRSRASRVSDFESFQNSAEALFKKWQMANPDYLSLEDYLWIYSLP